MSMTDVELLKAHVELGTYIKFLGRALSYINGFVFYFFKNHKKTIYYLGLSFEKLVKELFDRFWSDKFWFIHFDTPSLDLVYRSELKSSNQIIENYFNTNDIKFDPNFFDPDNILQLNNKISALEITTQKANIDLFDIDEVNNKLITKSFYYGKHLTTNEYGLILGINKILKTLVFKLENSIILKFGNMYFLRARINKFSNLYKKSEIFFNSCEIEYKKLKKIIYLILLANKYDISSYFKKLPKEIMRIILNFI